MYLSICLNYRLQLPLKSCALPASCVSVAGVASFVNRLHVRWGSSSSKGNELSFGVTDILSVCITSLGQTNAIERLSSYWQRLGRLSGHGNAGRVADDRESAAR